MPRSRIQRLHLLGGGHRRHGARRGRGGRRLSARGPIALAIIATGLPLALAAAARAGAGQGEPRLDWLLQCQGCHGAGALGNRSAGVPRMAGEVARFLRVPGGRAYLVQVPGVAQAPLSDAAIAELLNWMLVRFGPEELPEPFEPYTEAEVARDRAAAPIDVVATRARLLEQLDGLAAPADR